MLVRELSLLIQDNSSQGLDQGNPAPSITQNMGDVNLKSNSEQETTGSRTGCTSQGPVCVYRKKMNNI
ncbi:hypothetical protein CHARACLAT_004471 [Characodon lateralis]|uniref:Uncharacterized protein n=1 Tax=Characodon lateralis TaxID=208331 RepID=A0ABU7DNB2_9TELE|nr:hypothetical protein [Characodon lateralis]